MTTNAEITVRSICAAATLEHAMPEDNDPSEEEWLRGVNVAACAVLGVYIVLVASFGPDDALVCLRYIRHSTLHTSSAIDVGRAYIAALCVQLAGHGITAIAYRCKPIQGIALVIAVPVMHAAVLVGVAGVEEAWAVFAVVTLTVLILAQMLRLSDTKSAGTMQVLYNITLAAVYVAFWGVAWVLGDSVATKRLGGFTGGLVVVGMTYCWSVREGAYVRGMERLSSEMATITASIGFSTTAVIVWIAGHDAGSGWIIAAMLIIHVVLCVTAWLRLKQVVKASVSSVRESLVSSFAMDSDDADDPLGTNISEVDVADDPYTTSKI